MNLLTDLEISRCFIVIALHIDRMSGQV